MHRKAILIIAAVTLLTFGNSLGNGFVGDDDVVIVRNTFYTSWKNFPRLFAHDYLTDSDIVFNSKGEYFHSGSVAYRPVLSQAKANTSPDSPAPRADHFIPFHLAI